MKITIIKALIIYFATSIDEIPVLFMLYRNADNRGKARTITITYFIATFLIIGAGLLGGLGLLQIPIKWTIGFIGLLPLIMGILRILKDDDKDEEPMGSIGKKRGLWFQVLVLTISLGADDLSMYIPVFVTLSGIEIVCVLVIFALGVLFLCVFSYRLTHLDKLNAYMEHKERYMEGVIFILIGLITLFECGTITKLLQLF